MTNQPLSLAKQLELLRLEYEYEKEAFRRETAVMGIDRKVRRGDCSCFPRLPILKSKPS